MENCGFNLKFEEFLMPQIVKLYPVLVVFVPPISPLMQKTYKHLKDCSFKVLNTNL